MSAPPVAESPTAPPEARAVGEGGVGEGAAPCAACGAGTVGPYCHACGERRPRPEDESLGAFLREQAHEVTSADGRMWRSLKALFVPGKLTEEYFAGRRGLYLRPVRLFLVANVAFFFVLGFANTTGLRGEADFYREFKDFGPRATKMMGGAASEAGVRQDVYDAAFDAHSDTLSRTLVGLLVPLYALAFAVVFVRQRRPFARHAVFATTFVAFLLAWITVVAGFVLGGGYILTAIRALSSGKATYAVEGAILFPIILIGIVAYLVVGLRRAYGLRWRWSVPLGLAFSTAGFSVALDLYQRALFYVAFYTLDVPTP